MLLKKNDVRGCMGKVRCLRIRRPNMLALLASLEVQVTTERRQKEIKIVFKGSNFSSADLNTFGRCFELL